MLLTLRDTHCHPEVTQSLASPYMFLSNQKNLGGSVTEWLERRTCIRESPSSCPALLARFFLGSPELTSSIMLAEKNSQLVYLQ